MKNMKWIISGFACIAVLCTGLLGYRRLNGGNVVYGVNLEDVNGEFIQITESGTNTLTRMTALAENQEQAEEIAGLYQIELISYAEGVAVFETDKDPQKLIDLGTENGYPEIWIERLNHTSGQP